MDIFTSGRRGKFSVMEGYEGVPGRLDLEDFESLTAIVQTPTLGQGVNIQFMTSLANAVYAYVFGDKMGNISLRGIAFAGPCEGSDSGLKEVYDYYSSHRASQRRELVTVTIGPVTLSGFLTQLTISERDAERMLLNFELTINTLPKKES